MTHSAVRPQEAAGADGAKKLPGQPVPAGAKRAVLPSRGRSSREGGGAPVGGATGQGAVLLGRRGLPRVLCAYISEQPWNTLSHGAEERTRTPASVLHCASLHCLPTPPSGQSVWD